jgi:perosamine synthetase
VGEVADRPTLPYTRHTLTRTDEDAVLRALRSGRLAQGPEAAAFESELAAYTGAPHAAAVSSGTAALELALAALGVGPGDEVVVPTLTFVATANAVRACGATPVLADVEPDTLNLCPESLAARLGPRTRGAVAVHYAGHPADVDALRHVLGAGRFLLEDAAHALGARLGSRPAGTLGDAACFSFHPAKLITTGEGGAVTTARADLDRRVRVLREHGLERDGGRFEGLGLPAEWRAEESGPWVYELHARGGNARLGELGAALGRSQLGRADAQVARRRAIAEAYRGALADEEALALPIERPGAASAWHLFPIRLRRDCAPLSRAALYGALHARGIGVQVHYVPVHLQPDLRRLAGTRWGDLPVAEAAYLELLSLPLFPDLSEDETFRVVDALRSALREARR